MARGQDHQPLQPACYLRRPELDTERVRIKRHPFAKAKRGRSMIDSDAGEMRVVTLPGQAEARLYLRMHGFASKLRNSTAARHPYKYGCAATPRMRRSQRSIRSVTGPAFTSSTSIIAPNSPVSTVSPVERSCEMKDS